jgi:hypothetical protein
MVNEAVERHANDSTLIAQLSYGRWHENISEKTLYSLLRTFVKKGAAETALVVLSHRLNSKPEELAWWKDFALELVLRPELIRSSQMVSHDWKEVASRLVPLHAREVAEGIIAEQAHEDRETWFVEFSEASSVLDECVERDASAVWCAITERLKTPLDAFRFTTGFPPHLLGRIPKKEINDWIAVKPAERAAILARISGADFSSDDSIPSRLLGDYGDDPQVGDAFFSAYVSGTWMGPASEHWISLAQETERVAERTALPKLRGWAVASAARLREMAARDRQREEEEELRDDRG